MKETIGATCFLLLVLSVGGAPDAAANDEDPLDRAARAVSDGKWSVAVEELRTVFGAGYATPSDVYTDPRFSDLREKADARGRWRELMGEYVAESRIRIAPPDEPGEPMLIRGRVVDGEGSGIPGAILQLYHTDATGEYEPGRPAGDGSNPRLFGFVRSDADGRFEVRTIKPASYPGSNARSAHVHYRIRAEGYRDEVDEFRPYTKPETAAERRAAVSRGQASSLVHEEDGVLVCEVVLPMETR